MLHARAATSVVTSTLSPIELCADSENYIVTSIKKRKEKADRAGNDSLGLNVEINS